MQHNIQKQIVLGSSSKTRQKVLSRLKIPFIIISPDIDETANKNETVQELTERLSIEKAQAVADKIREPSLIISGDQVLSIDNQVFGKPHTTEKAKEQLSMFSNKTASFITSMCLYDNTCKSIQAKTTETKIKFRKLSENEIENYIAIEQPFECAGSFKAEGLGISLINSIESDDPYAILGVPLIHLCKLLREAGYNLYYH